MKEPLARAHRGPLLYRELSDCYPLLTPVGDYAEEAAFYRRLFEERCRRPPRTRLDLGSGAGHNAAHLEATLACTLVDLAPAMLELSRLEPGTETGGSDAGGRGLRYLEWRWVPEAARETYVTDMAYVLRDESGNVEVVHDRHVTGLFPRGDGNTHRYAYGKSVDCPEAVQCQLCGDGELAPPCG